MIFRPLLVAAILEGRKTVTRRSRRHGEACKYQEGRTYAIQPGRGAEALARILILSVEESTPGAVDDAEALLEGFATAAAFQSYWTGLYGSYDPDTPVWRIRFELVTPTKEHHG